MNKLIDEAHHSVPPSLPPRLRLKAAAEYVGLSPKSLGDRGWRRRHGIPCLKIGRAVVFDRADLDRWLAKHKERLPREDDLLAAA